MEREKIIKSKINDIKKRKNDYDNNILRKYEKYKRDPITQSQAYYSKKIISSIKPLEIKLFKTQGIKQSIDEKYQRKIKSKINFEKKDDLNWKPSCKLIDEYKNKLREDNTIIRRGVKKIVYKNSGRNPINQENEVIIPIKEKNQFKASNIYKFINDKEIFELRIQNNKIKSLYENKASSRNSCSFRQRKVLESTDTLRNSNGFRINSLLKSGDSSYLGNLDLKKPNNLKLSHGVFEEFKNKNVYNLYNKKKNDHINLNSYASKLRA